MVKKQKRLETRKKQPNECLRQQNWTVSFTEQSAVVSVTEADCWNSVSECFHLLLRADFSCVFCHRSPSLKMNQQLCGAFKHFIYWKRQHSLVLFDIFFNQAESYIEQIKDSVWHAGKDWTSYVFLLTVRSRFISINENFF